MNINTWNQFGINEVLLICLAAAGFMAVIVVIATAGKKVNNNEQTLKTVRRLQTLEPEERVLDK